MPARRPLRFASMSEIMPEVDRLLAGHTTVGNWGLGQICNHLASGIRVSVEGVPERAPWLLRKTVAPIFLRKILRAEAMREGLRLPEEFWPKPDLNARAEAEALRATIHLFQQASGPFAEHPFFGKISDDDWRKFHRIHCAHHLSFALPA